MVKNEDLSLDSSKGIQWYDKKRLRKLKAFIRLLKKKEKIIPKDKALFEKINDLKNIYIDLLDYYENYKFELTPHKIDLNRLKYLDIDKINKKAEEINLLINQLEKIHAKISKKVKLEVGSYIFLKNKDRSYIYIISDKTKKGYLINGLKYLKGCYSFSKGIINEQNESWYFQRSDLEPFTLKDDWKEISLLRKKGYLIGRAIDYNKSDQSLELTLGKIQKTIENSKNNFYRIPVSFSTPLYNSHVIPPMIGVIFSEGTITRAFVSDASSGSNNKLKILKSVMKPQPVRYVLTNKSQGELFIKNWVIDGIFYNESWIPSYKEYIIKIREFAKKNNLKLYILKNDGNWEIYQYKNNEWTLIYKSKDHLSEFEYSINFFK